MAGKKIFWSVELVASNRCFWMISQPTVLMSKLLVRYSDESSRPKVRCSTVQNYKIASSSLSTKLRTLPWVRIKWMSCGFIVDGSPFPGSAEGLPVPSIGGRSGHLIYSISSHPLLIAPMSASTVARRLSYGNCGTSQWESRNPIDYRGKSWHPTMSPSPPRLPDK